MNSKEAIELSGFQLCEFKADGEDECSTCGQIIPKGNDVYYEQTCYESDEGEYHCITCTINKHKEWDGIEYTVEAIDNLRGND